MLDGTYNNGTELRNAVRRFEDAVDRSNLRVLEIKDTIQVVLATADREMGKATLYDETLANLSHDSRRPMERHHFDALLAELVDEGSVVRRMVGKAIAKYSV